MTVCQIVIQKVFQRSAKITWVFAHRQKRSRGDPGDLAAGGKEKRRKVVSGWYIISIYLPIRKVAKKVCTCTFESSHFLPLCPYILSHPSFLVIIFAIFNFLSEKLSCPSCLAALNATGAFMADTSIEMQMVASIFISSGVHNVSGELPFPEFLQGKVKPDRP